MEGFVTTSTPKQSNNLVKKLLQRTLKNCDKDTEV